jgi:hypothetical protein
VTTDLITTSMIEGGVEKGSFKHPIVTQQLRQMPLAALARR